METILTLDQDGDGLETRNDPDLDNDGIDNFHDEDIDGDGVKNVLDPSPYDRREKGYNPFAVLGFLSWNHEWNNFKYDEKNLEETVKLLKKMGVSFVRMDFYWEDIEPRQGFFDFKKYDFVVQLLSENNIGILGILDYSASWAAPGWNNPPYNDEDFVNYAVKVVHRYMNRIKYWEIWNEPDSKFYWSPQDNMKRYAQLLKNTYTTVKKTDPSCKILMGGLTQGGYYALQDLYRQDGKQYFDIVNFHPFVNPLTGNPEDSVRALYKNLKKLMEKYNDGNKKIWFTEIGSPGINKRISDNKWWEGESPDERQQAGFVTTVYSKIIELEDVEKVFWAFFRDNKEHFKSAVDYFGLIRWDLSKKPSFYSYRKAYLRWHRHQVNNRRN